MTEKQPLRIGLIGTGFMGKAHVFGYASAERVFDLPHRFVFHTLADATQDLAEAAAARFGFARASGDWRDLVADPEIDVINITAPNALHHQMALAAIAAGKHVYCEKPLALRVSEAEEMTAAAESAGVVTQVGFNYLCNPMIRLARQMIDSGELGEIRSFRGVHAEDFMTDPQAPAGFRHEIAGGGALVDIGSHIIATAEYLIGPIRALMGDCVTHVTTRPSPSGPKQIEIDDISRAFLRFENGASGSLEANWMATGRKMQHDFEISGSRGGLFFSQERFNELHYYHVDDQGGRSGFRRIEASPDHPPYGDFCVAPGHQIGFNDLKAIEVAGFSRAIAGQQPEFYNFRAATRIQTLIEAIQTSSRSQAWVQT